MSTTFSTQIEELNDWNQLWSVLQDLAALGEVGLRIVKTFALDCAERALPAYEAQHPGDLRVRAAIEVSRRYLRGETTIDEAKTAANAACAVYAAANTAYAAADAASADAASAAADAAAAFDGARAAHAAAYAAEAATFAAYDDYAAAAELRWQRAHLIKLLEAAE